MDWLLFCEKTKNVLGNIASRLLFEYDEDVLTYKVKDRVYSYSKEDYSQLTSRASLYSFQPYTIISENSYESLIDLPDIDSRRYIPGNIEDKLLNVVFEDNENNLKYSFKEASQELFWFIMQTYDNRRLIRFITPMMYERRIESNEFIDIFGLLNLVLRLPFSVCIQSSKQTSQEQISRFAKSFLFNFAYNLDLVFRPVTEANEIFPQRVFTTRKRIHNIDEIEAPKLSYVHELTEQYFMALASTDPFVKFIGFYHIMEYFFEDVYNDDIYKSVQGIIQHPGFSAKRKKDVTKVIDLVRRKTRQNKEDFQGSELEALELTIKNFVNITDMINDLTEYDDTLIEYYINQQVNFSDGDTIDLRDVANEKLPKKMAARIYKTRNALVHSKSNDGRISERGIYKPFKDGPILLKEIPLMKYIAETIIINSATSF